MCLFGEIESFYVIDSSWYKEDVVWYYYGIFYKNLNWFEESEVYFNWYEVLYWDVKYFWLVVVVNMAKVNLYFDMGDFVCSMEVVLEVYCVYEFVWDILGMLVIGNKLGVLYIEVDWMEDVIV